MVPEFEREGRYLQHYCDSRAVARLYQMTFMNGIWELWRERADFSALDFAQHYRGTVGADGTTIAGGWEIQRPGTPWQLDFGLTCTRA